MYVSLSRLSLPVNRTPELVAGFRNHSRLADEANRFIDLELWQSDRNPGESSLISRWRDRDAFKAYMNSGEHRVSHDRIDKNLQRDVALLRLEHLHTCEVVAE